EIAGPLIALVTIMLMRTIDPAWNALRISRAGWRSVARLAERGTRDLRGWATEMLDRLGLVTSRFTALGREPSPGIDGLRDLRVGLDVGAIEAVDVAGDHATQEALWRVRAAVAGTYDAWLRGAPDADEDANDAPTASVIDAGIAALSTRPASDGKRKALAALVGLRLDLAPQAPGFGAWAP
ncbi:MAG TPA: FUSC family protein, partial [Rhizomicrobium sp.]